MRDEKRGRGGATRGGRGRGEERMGEGRGRQGRMGRVGEGERKR